MSATANPEDMELLLAVERRMRDGLIEKASSQGLDPHEVSFARSLERTRTEVLDVILNSIDRTGF